MPDQSGDWLPAWRSAGDDYINRPFGAESFLLLEGNVPNSLDSRHVGNVRAPLAVVNPATIRFSGTHSQSSREYNPDTRELAPQSVVGGPSNGSESFASATRFHAKEITT